MARQKLNVEKRQVRLYSGDVEEIQKLYPNIPYNAVLREVIHAWVKSLREGNAGVIRYDPTKLRLDDD